MERLFKIILLLTTLTTFFVRTLGTELECKYFDQKCDLYGINFSSSSQSVNYSFSGSEAQKKKVTDVNMWRPDAVDFIPLELYREFPSLHTLHIRDTQIPILKNGFFASESSGITILYLPLNNIRSIEPLAFKELINVMMLNLSDNLIKFLDDLLFKTNTKLEFVNFSRNRISRVNPNLFDNLNKIRIIDFFDYLGKSSCIKTKVGCNECLVKQSEIDKQFSTCFRKCRAHTSCSSKIETNRTILDFEEESTTISTTNRIQVTTIVPTKNEEHEAANRMNQELEEELTVFNNTLTTEFTELKDELSKLSLSSSAIADQILQLLNNNVNLKESIRDYKLKNEEIEKQLQEIEANFST